MLLDQSPLYLQGYLLARPADASHLLSTMESLPQHMESLLLTFPPKPGQAEDTAAPGRSTARARTS